MPSGEVDKKASGDGDICCCDNGNTFLRETGPGVAAALGLVAANGDAQADLGSLIRHRLGITLEEVELETLIKRLPETGLDDLARGLERLGWAAHLRRCGNCRPWRRTK